jgi:hypothetical protein
MLFWLQSTKSRGGDRKLSRRPDDTDVAMKLPSALLLSPKNTDRPVDARWRRVADLARRRRHPWGRWDDDWVRRGLRYVNRLRACLGNADRARLAAEMPDVDAACRLHLTTDKVARGALEARLLAGQSVEEVAACCGLTPEAVTAYVRLFFDVLGSLRARSYILIHAIGPKHFHGLTEDDPDVILKWAGFVKGVALLEPLTRYFTLGWRVPEQPDSLSRDELDELYTMCLMRLLVLSRVMPPGRPRRALAVLELAERLKTFIDSHPVGAENVPSNGGLDSLLIAEQCRWVGAWRTVAPGASQERGASREMTSPEERTGPTPARGAARGKEKGVEHVVGDKGFASLLLPFDPPQRAGREGLPGQRRGRPAGRPLGRAAAPSGAERPPGPAGRAGEVGPGDPGIAGVDSNDRNASPRRPDGGRVPRAPWSVAEKKDVETDRP